MSGMRRIDLTELRSLKAATRRAVEMAGDIRAVEPITRVKKPALSKYMAMHEDGHFMPVDVVIDVDRAAAEPVILREMAALEGFDLVGRSGQANSYRASAMQRAQLVGRLTREVADVIAEVLTADADGIITPRERSALLKEIDEAMAALNALRAGVEAS